MRGIDRGFANLCNKMNMFDRGFGYCGYNRGCAPLLYESKVCMYLFLYACRYELMLACLHAYIKVCPHPYIINI